MNDVVVPAVSAIGGGVSVGWVAKVLLQNWFKRNEENHDKAATQIQSMSIGMTRIEEQLKVLGRIEAASRDQDKVLAVLQARFEKLMDDVNRMGRKLRENPSEG